MLPTRQFAPVRVLNATGTPHRFRGRTPGSDRLVHILKEPG
jgi:hypothetical protein